jgi:glycosyltransferase involved in cell wall biosynthesis
MAAPKLSVLMTVRNGERHLGAAVESVLGQSFGDFEFLIRDDGSSDSTPALLREYAARDPRLRVWVDEPNLGIVPSMNRLFGLARGEYVNRHDADDVSLPGRYARQVEYLDIHPEVGVLGTQVETIDEAGQPEANQANFTNATTHAELEADLLAGRSMCQGSVMFRRALLDQVGLYDEALEQAEDHDLWLRMAEVTQLASLPETHYQYRQHAGGITKRRYFRALADKATVLERNARRRAGDGLSPKQQQALAGHYLRAGLEAQTAGELKAAQAALSRASRLDPQLWDQRDSAAEQMVQQWFDERVSNRPVEEGLALVETVFANLPPARAATRLRGQLLAKVHLREAYYNGRKAGRRAVRGHVLASMRHDPKWLLNRGVWVFLARHMGPDKRRPGPT